MNAKRAFGGLTVLVLLVAGSHFVLPSEASAHCDTMSGPVIADAKKAIELEDVNPVLKWVRPHDEKEIRTLFEKTLDARQKGEDVQELVDMHFFETLVRVHRAGEGAPYTGLKPADTPLEPGIEAAERGLEIESDEALVDALKAKLESSVHERFERTVETRKHKDEGVAQGREYVEAYVDYIHYVERVHMVLSATAAHQHGADADEHVGSSTTRNAKVHRH